MFNTEICNHMVRKYPISFSWFPGTESETGKAIWAIYVRVPKLFRHKDQLILRVYSEELANEFVDFGNRNITFERWAGSNKRELDMVRCLGPDFCVWNKDFLKGVETKTGALTSVNGAVFYADAIDDWCRWEVRNFYTPPTTEMGFAELAAMAIFVASGYNFPGITFHYE